MSLPHYLRAALVEFTDTSGSVHRIVATYPSINFQTGELTGRVYDDVYAVTYETVIVPASQLRSLAAYEGSHDQLSAINRPYLRARQGHAVADTEREQATAAAESARASARPQPADTNRVSMFTPGRRATVTAPGGAVHDVEVVQLHGDDLAEVRVLTMHGAPTMMLTVRSLAWNFD